MSFLDKLIAPFQIGLRHTVESFIRLETVDNENTIVASDGSLLTYVRVDGSKQIIGEEEYKFLIEGSTIKMGSRFDRTGHAIQVFFTRDPDRIKAHLTQNIRPGRVTAENVDLELGDVFDERVRNLSKFLTYEECFFVLWTRPSVLTKNEYERSAKESKSDKWVSAGFAQDPMAAIDALRTRHKSYTAAIMSAMDELGISAQIMDAHDALRAVRDTLYPTKANEKWRACLPGDPIPPRAPKSKADMSEILWPPLSQQLTQADARILNENTVKIGDLIWSGADMALGPMDPSPFPMLLNRLFEANVPYRISFLIEGGGAYATQFRAFLATILGVTNALNKQIKFSLEGLQRMARSEPVVRLRVSFATWAPARNMDLLQDRLSVMIQAVESWGYCQVSEFSGDPLDCVMSSALGIHCSSTAPMSVAPMYEVMKLLPWQRPSSPFDTGSLMLRTPDGKLWPYQTGTNLTTTWFDLIFAQPGAGKSVLMNSINFSTCTSPGLNKLPYVAIVDIGPSSSGLISLIKEALPQNRQDEAAYHRIQMTHQYAVNPFDTQLGCRYPMIDERSYLIELLTLLCTPPGHQTPYDGIQQLAGFVIDEMYRWRDDKAASSEAKPYLPRLDKDIDETLFKHNIQLPSDPYWWDVVDKLFDCGEYHMAVIAQRYASPTLSDAITASRRPQIRTLMEETVISGSSESVINAFERMIISAIREYPILSSITKFDVDETRVCSIDLMDVSPQGDDTAERQTSIMYMLARHMLVRTWWIGREMLAQIPDKYQGYHEMRLQDVMETPKRLCYDEFHRTSKSASVRAQVIRDVREGRKRGVQICLASQLLDDFDDDMVDLATGIWVLGTAISDQAVDNVVERFGLSDTARHIIRYKLTGPKAVGAPALVVLGTTEGRYEQHLYNTLGPIELWAFSTSAEDVQIRSKLYEILGAGRARQMLAANFPGGSARSEIKRRVLMMSEGEDNRSAMTSKVVEDIINELVEASERKRVGPQSSDKTAKQRAVPKPAQQPESSTKTEKPESEKTE